MQKRSMLKPAQMATMELLKVVSEVSGKNEINFCMIEDAVLSAYENEGFLPWLPRVTIGMFYNEYQKFIKCCRSELQGSEYYLMTHDNTEQFDEFYIRLTKRSNVRLGKGREHDEKYYDFYINIKPIFYAGDTISEYRRIEQMYLKYYRILNSRCITPGMLKAGKVKIRNIISAYYYKNRNTINYDDMLHELCKYVRKTKYIFIPEAIRHHRGEIEIEQYENRRKIKFEAMELPFVNDVEKYIRSRYGRKYHTIAKERQVSQAELEGPEILRRIQLIELELLKEYDRICRKHDIKYMIGAGTALGAVRHKGFIPWDDDIDVFMVYDEYKKFIEVADKELDHNKYFLKTQKTDLDCNLTFIQLKRNNTILSKKGREQFNTHPGVLIDIIPLFNAPNTRIGHWMQDKVCKFYRTMTWAHIGAESEKSPIKKEYYRWLARKSNKYAYGKFMKFATMISANKEELTFFYVARNFKENPVNERRLYENLEEIEFEGEKFYITKFWDYYLKYTYSKDYMMFPLLQYRTQKHMPAVIDCGELYKSLDTRREET